MRKSLCFAIFGLILAILVTPITSPAQADTYSVSFLASTYEGYDGFHENSVVAYEAGSTARLVVAVNNFGFNIDGYYYDKTANVSAVGVRFDWMAPNSYINSTECDPSSPYELGYEGYHIFMIEFEVPTTPTTLNLVLHEFEIVIVNISDIKDPNAKQDVIWNWSGYNFAVYSTDQADAQELDQELMHKLYYYPSFSVFEAGLLRADASTEGSTASMYYQRGDFANAKMHLQTALNLLDKALETEWSGLIASAEASNSLLTVQMDYYDSVMDATKKEVEAAETEANAAMMQAYAARTQANAALIQAYAWLLGAIGIMIGIGAVAVVVYVIKKPKAPTWE